MCRLSLVAASRGYSLAVGQELGMSVASLVLWSTDSRAQAQESLVARRHVESSWTRDQTHVPCTGRWILRHWTTSGVRFGIFSVTRSLCSWLLAAGAVGSVQGHSYQPSCEPGTPCV